MNTVEYFRNNQEEMPKWLKDYKVGNKIDVNEVLKHRVVYYPGAGTDGQPIKTYNKAHYAHTYFYVDYGPTKEETYNDLCKEGALKGYKLLDIQEISESELSPKGWRPHFIPTQEEQVKIKRRFQNINPYCYIAIYEREDGYDESHGVKRLCLIYLFADGIAAYDAVFANYNRNVSLLVLQDHGMGGNYNHFGRNGYLEQIANNTNTYPEYITCEYYINTWHGYKQEKEVRHEIGGMHGNHRFLFKRY